MSQASESSLPTPVARPRMEAIDTTGARLRRTSISGRGTETPSRTIRVTLSSDPKYCRVTARAGAFYVMDRGYMDFERRRYSHNVDKTTGVRSDHCARHIDP